MPSERYTRKDLVLSLSGTPDEPGRLFETRPFLQGPRWDFELDRVVLDIAEEDRAAHDWESIVRRSLSTRFPIVRRSPVRPRVGSIELTFPIRVLEIGGPVVVAPALETLFNGRPRDYAMTTAATTMDAAPGLLDSLGWATADIVHVHDMPYGERMLSMSRADEAGTAGWLTRLANTRQTRLLLLEGHPDGMPYLRMVAHAIVHRGGPAVWLFETGQLDVVNTYADIIHDRPLDWIQQFAGGTLFGGGGREELLRYSLIGEKLAAAAPPPSVVWQQPPFFIPVERDFVAGVVREALDDLRIDYGNDTIPWIDDARCMRLDDSISSKLAERGLIVPPLDVFRGARGSEHIRLDDVADVYSRYVCPAGTTSAYAAIGERVRQFRELMPHLQFESHESDGMLPLAQKVTSIRVMREVSERMAANYTSIQKSHDPLEMSWQRPPRAVNAWFADESDGPEPRRIEQSGARFSPGRIINLAILIGERDVTIETSGRMDLIEERIEYVPGLGGAWLEIGVTGIDFDVLGDPVQEVWLPEIISMRTPVFFAVRPGLETTVPGVARLRIAIYHRNNVVQSFLMAALLTNAEGNGAHLLERALGAPVNFEKEPGYLARPEYSTVVGVDRAGAVEERALSIIANESAGEKVITVKGEDLFTARRGANLPPKVDAARDALKRASMSGGAYRYTYDPQVDNSGNPAQLLDSLWDIALAGWDLFNFFVSGRKQQEQVRERLARGGGIHAAHLDLESVIPWSLLYDRPVKWNEKLYEDAADPKARVFDLRRAICPAGRPSAGGTVSLAPCGQETDCLLTRANLDAERQAGGTVVSEETVICPRRFWGFTQPIEVPVQQQAGGNAPPAPLRAAIRISRPAEVVAGFNEHLQLANEHRTAIEKFCRLTKTRLVTAVTQSRDAVLQILNRDTPAVVYIYCHAYPEAEEGGKRIGPNLSFGPKATIRDALTASQLSGGPWVHHPLVFLNGCATAGFDPCAPSEFITEFVQGREASAVIGTEVTVWEMLAGEVAAEFFEAFLDDGNTAGEALLRVRGKLLAKANPLGLVYTLYGTSSLKVEWT